MKDFNAPQYLLDGNPISANGLIREAEFYSEKFKNDWLKSTSAAAHILRQEGFTVENNPEFKQ